MCPTPIGRLHTRVATIWGPLLLAAIITAITGFEDWVVLIGVFLLMGATLDLVVYPQVLKYQPPWMTGVLALFELGVLWSLANILELRISDLDAILFYWGAWALATATRIAILPIVSLTYIESSGEFRRIQWSIPPEQASTPVLASPDEKPLTAGSLLDRASGVHAVPLEKKPALSGVQAVPRPQSPVGGS